MTAAAIPVPVGRGSGGRETVARWSRRGGPLLDFISANFLYILSAVAVIGVASGAYANFERNSYSNDLRAIQTTFVQASTHASLASLTWGRVPALLPPSITLDADVGRIYFGGLLGEGIPMAVYGGDSGVATAVALGAGTVRQLVLVVGDTNTPANEDSAVCIALARGGRVDLHTLGKLVFRTYQQHQDDEWASSALDLIDRLCLEGPDEAAQHFGEFER